MKIMQLIKIKNIIEGPVMSLGGLIIIILGVVGVIWFELEWSKAWPILLMGAGALGLNEKDFKNKKPK